MKYLLSLVLLIPVQIAKAQQDIAIHKLKEVEVLSDMGRYKRDSAFMDTVYRKAFKDANSKIKFKMTNGLVFENLPSEVAKKLTGRKKREKKFLHTYQAMQSEKLVAIRYNSSSVGSVTGLKGDDAARFINANPMSEGFARTASELELKMWIRDHYKRWRDNKPSE